MSAAQIAAKNPEMAYSYLPSESVAVTGTGSSANLVAFSAGQSIRVWQLLVASSSSSGTSATLTWTAAGTSTTATFNVPATSTLIVPYTGAPWAIADVGTAVTFNAATTTVVTAYLTKAQGGQMAVNGRPSAA